MVDLSDDAMKLLVYLGWRVVYAKRYLRRALKENSPQPRIDTYRSAETEAWNAFQGAKQLLWPIEKG